MTSHAEIERHAFELFHVKGFAATTIDDIAASVGISRRTLFRYYPSKNDIPWGQFAPTLDALERTLDLTPDELPVHEAVQRAVVEFNRFPESEHRSHRDRMRLILETPALQAHSVHQYDKWRMIITHYVARRHGVTAEHLLPRTAGHATLALAISAYEHWLSQRGATLADLLGMIDESLAALRHHLAH